MAFAGGHIPDRKDIGSVLYKGVLKMAAGKRLAAEYKHYLFNKGILVNDTGENRRDCVRALFTLADVFGIRITKDPVRHPR